MTSEVVNKGRRVNDDKLESLESRYNHLDGRVTAVAQDMASVKATMGQLLDMVKNLADRQNTPTPWPALVSAVVAVISIVGAIGFLAIGPIQDRQNMLVAAAQASMERERSLAYDQGRHYQALTDLRTSLEGQHSTLLEHAKELGDLNRYTTRNRTSIQSIGDYTEEFRALYEKHHHANGISEY